MEGFQINYTDLSDLFWEYKRKIENLIENIDNCIEKINMFTEMQYLQEKPETQ